MDVHAHADHDHRSARRTYYEAASADQGPQKPTSITTAVACHTIRLEPKVEQARTVPGSWASTSTAIAVCVSGPPSSADKQGAMKT